jgi:hypothetical protein
MMKQYSGPVMWVLLGAVLGGGGVYSLGLRGGRARVHVGAERPAGTAAVTPADAGAASASSSQALAADSPAAGSSSSGMAGSLAPVPGAALQAPRPAGDRLMIAQDAPDTQAHERTSAFVANAPVVKAETTASAPAAHAAPAAVPQAHLAAVGSVRYGMAGRSELMGRGAGPVYNLKGASNSQPGDVNTLIKQVGPMVQAAEQQVDQSTMDDAAKAALKQNIQSATAGIPAQ